MTTRVGRMTASHITQLAVAIALVPIGVSALLLALLSDHLERPVATGLYRAYLAVVPMLVGLYWWRRRPASRVGPLLIAFGLAAWVVSWQSSDWPLAFDLGVLAEAPATVLTFALFLVFPSGRPTVTDRILIAGWIVGVLGFFVPWVLGSPAIAGGGPFSTCVPACPENVLQIVTAPDLVALLGRWETYLMLALAVAVLVVYGRRLVVASRPRRRAMIAVAVTSLLFVPTFFVFHFSRLILELDAATLDAMSWFVVGTRVLLPLGFLVALVQADLHAGAVRRDLLTDLVGRPSPERWRDAVATALDDPQLRMAYWDPASANYRQADGVELTRSTDTGRTWLEIAWNDRPVAAMDIDGALAEDPELVDAAASATQLAVENGNLEGELRSTQARVLATGDAVRRRIERDLHDSAQQRLVALRIHLELASESMGSAQREMVAQLGDEVDGALDDLRNVARGAYPAGLREGGVGAALRAFARHATLPVTVADDWLRRPSDEIELAVYFCCVEALQNAAKHAGADARATVRLSEDDHAVNFSVEDDGVGFDPVTAARGAGLENIGHRVSAAGGELRIDSAAGSGTRVFARLPV